MTYDGTTGNTLTAVANSGGLNATTTFTYNAVGQPLTTRNPVGTVTQYVYDGFGNRTATIADANTLRQTTTAAYDSVGNVTSATDPRGAVTTTTFDAARQRLTATTPATPAALSGLVTANTYDANGQVLQVQQSAGGTLLRTTSATFDAARQLLTATTPATPAALSGLVTANTYDANGQVLQVQQSAGGTVLRTTSATYTLSGKTATATDARGNITRYTYDLLDRLVTTTYPGGSTEGLTYDADGNITLRCTRAGQPIGYAYDTLNRMSSKILPGTAANCTNTPAGTVTSYSYDLAGRTTGISDNSAAIPAIATPSSALVYNTTYTYDAMNRPIGVSFDPAPTPTLPSTGASITFTHGYNAANQRNSLAVTDNAWINYPAATASDTCYTTNTLNQYTQLKNTITTTCDTVVANPAYDTNGNLADDGSSYKFEYDAENRLTKSKTSGGSTIGTYTFDAQGRRTSKTVSGTTTVYVTDADNREVLEYDGSAGAIQRWYTYALGPNAVLGQMNVAAGTRSTPVPDLLGSIIGTMNASSGTLTSFAYRPYGSSGSPPSQFGYTGQRIDTETSELYYYRARNYSAAWGRFLQADPVGYSAGPHLYAYVGNDPLNLLDPFGFSAEGPRGGVGSTAFRLGSYFSDSARDLADLPSRIASDVGGGGERPRYRFPAVP